MGISICLCRSSFVKTKEICRPSSRKRTHQKRRLNICSVANAPLIPYRTPSVQSTFSRSPLVLKRMESWPHSKLFWNLGTIQQCLEFLPFVLFAFLCCVSRGPLTEASMTSRVQQNTVLYASLTHSITENKISWQERVHYNFQKVWICITCRTIFADDGFSNDWKIMCGFGCSNPDYFIGRIEL